MLKNNAFKSFLSVLFLLAGLFAWEKSASAALFDYNYNWNTQNLGNENVIGLYFEPTATTSLNAVSFLFKDNPAPGTEQYLYLYNVNCTDHIKDTLLASSGNLNITEQTTFEVHTAAIPLVSLYPGNCYYVFIAGNYIDSGIYDQDISNLGLPGTATKALAVNRNSPYSLELATTSAGYKLPYFKLFSTFTSPSIQIINPIADTIITEKDFNYMFTATRDVLSTVSVLFQVFPFGETETPQINNLYFFPVNGESVVTGSMNIDKQILVLGNATGYSLIATILDETNNIQSVATRTIGIDIFGNRSDNVITNATPIATYCQAEGIGGNTWFCKFITNFENDFYKKPPLSYLKSFKDGFLGVNATSSVNYTIIPTFIDDFFTWLWYIVFIVMILIFSNKLFKA